MVTEVAESILQSNETESAAEDNLGEYCWLNDSCPPSATDASASQESSSGMMMHYVMYCI